MKTYATANSLTWWELAVCFYIFHEQAKKLIGQTVQVRMSDGSTLIGRHMSVGTDLMIMRVRIRGTFDAFNTLILEFYFAICFNDAEITPI